MPRFVGLFVLVFVTGACHEKLTFPKNQQFAFISFDAVRSTSTGAYRTTPIGTIFHANSANIANTAAVPDSCIPLAFDNGTPPPEVLDYVDAGPSFTVKLGTSNLTLTKTVFGARQDYEAGAVTYTPGDSVRVTIPAVPDGFAGGAIIGKTAELFTFTTPGVPAVNVPLSLQWTAAGEPGSAMIVSLRFASPTSTTQNEQLYCVLADDGAFDIPSEQINRYRLGSNRTFLATRLRTNAIRNGNALLYIKSTFSVPTPTVP